MEPTTEWQIRDDQDVSFWHCDRAGYWDNDDVYCSKCQAKMEPTTDNLFAAITIDYSGFHGPVASGMTACLTWTGRQDEAEYVTTWAVGRQRPIQQKWK